METTEPLPVYQLDSFLALMRWRKAEAAASNLPAYCILHACTVASIAIARPKTLEDLSKIKGIGPSKLTQFGPEIIHIIIETSKEDAKISIS